MTLSQGEVSREYPDGRPPAQQPQWRHDFPTDVPEDDQVGRREFAKFLVLTSCAFVAGQAWIGLTSLFQQHGPLAARPVTRADGSPVRAEEVPVHGSVDFRYPTDDDPCVLVRLGDGRLVAYGQKCTHLSCAVIPEPDKGVLRCPCHHGYFELHEGRPVAGPPRRPLPTITLDVRDGVIHATGVELRTL
jgi:Rieske Fe-S protein